MQCRATNAQLDAQIDAQLGIGPDAKLRTALIKSCIRCRPMQSQMQSLNIKRPTEQSNQARASATLINYPAATAAAITISFSYFVLAVSTDCSVSTVLDLYRC